MNQVGLVGRLTKDPELRYTPSGVAVATFTLAVNRTFASANGEKEADFITVRVWRKPAENAANYLKKGSLAGVTGRIQTGSYEGTDGKRVYTTEVVADNVQFLSPVAGGAGNTGTQSNQPSNQQSNQSSNQQSNSNTQQNNQQKTTNQPQNQSQNTRVDEDPFFNSGGPIEVSDDDLPF
jgi:single-strand DNA-binding protein